MQKKRLNTAKIGLDSLKGMWYGKDFCYSRETILTSKEVLQGMIPTIEKQIAKAKEGQMSID